MRCVSCNRPLGIPTVQVNTKAGPLGWGPVCARRAGLLDKLPRARKPRSRAADVETNPDQLTLELAL